MSLAYNEFDKLERLVNCLPVRVATAKDLFVRFLGYVTPIHVNLLTLLLYFAMVGLDVIDQAIDQLDGLLKALDERLGWHCVVIFLLTRPIALHLIVLYPAHDRVQHGD